MHTYVYGTKPVKSRTSAYSFEVLGQPFSGVKCHVLLLHHLLLVGRGEGRNYNCSLAPLQLTFI